jgi:hypothetical protein
VACIFVRFAQRGTRDARAETGDEYKAYGAAALVPTSYVADARKDIIDARE